MSISSDLTQTLSAEDGFAIIVKASEGKELKRIAFSIVSLLDGIKQIEASGTSAKLKNLSNAQYLVTAEFTDGTSASMKAHSVAVPSAPLLSKSYVVPGTIVDEAPSNISDPQRAVLIGLDEKLKVIPGSFSSPSISDGKGPDEIAAMRVTHYEISLSDGDKIMTVPVTAEEADAGYEFAVPNYTRYECVVQAKSSLGYSSASAAFESLATNYPNKPGKIIFLSNEYAALTTDMRALLPLPSDYIEWSSNSSFLQGVTSDMIISNGEETIHVKVKDFDGNEMSFEHVKTEQNGLIWYMEVILKDIALGRVVQCTHTVANRLGVSEPSDPSDPTLNMRLSLYPARRYTLSRFLASSSSVRVTPNRRSTTMSTGFDETIKIDANSGVPVELMIGGQMQYSDLDAYSQGSSNLGVPRYREGGMSNSTQVYLENVTIQMMLSSNPEIPNPFDAYEEDAYVQYGALSHPAHDGGFHGPALPTTESRLSHDVQSVARLLSDTNSAVKWKAATGNTTGYIYDHHYKTTGYASVPIRPNLECTSEFSPEGGKVTFKLHGESGAQYGLSNFKLRVDSVQNAGNNASYARDEYDISDVKVGATGLSLTGLLNGVTALIRGEISGVYQVEQIEFPNNIKMTLSGLKGTLTSNSFPIQYMVKGESAYAIDEEADFSLQIGNEIKPFGKPAAPASITLDISEKHDEELMAQVAFAANNSGRKYKRMTVDTFDKNGEVYTTRQEGIVLNVTNDGRANNEQSLHLTKGATLTQNGDNATYRISVSNNLATEDSDKKESNTVVPFGQGEYSVEMTGKKITRTFKPDGRLITSEWAIGIDPTPSPNEAPLLQNMPAPINGQIGVRDSSINRATQTHTYTFSTSEDLSKHFVMATIEDGTVSPQTNFL